MYIDLSNALLKMSERDKELLTYRYTMEMSSKEISKITGIKESNVNSYIRRAREKLLKIFNGGMMALISSVNGSMKRGQ